MRGGGGELTGRGLSRPRQSYATCRARRLQARASSGDHELALSGDRVNKLGGLLGALRGVVVWLCVAGDAHPSGGELLIGAEDQAGDDVAFLPAEPLDVEVGQMDGQREQPRAVQLVRTTVCDLDVAVARQALQHRHGLCVVTLAPEALVEGVSVYLAQLSKALGLARTLVRNFEHRENRRVPVERASRSQTLRDLKSLVTQIRPALEIDAGSG